MQKVSSIVVTIALLLLGGTAGRLSAGSPDSPGAPTNPAAQMFTLDQIYQRLVTGTVSSPMTTFTEPGVAPGVGTMHTLNEIMASIPPPGTSVQGPDGLRSFLIPDGLYRTIIGPGFPIPITATANDSDLVAGNIKLGVTVFGVDGKLPGAGVAKTGQTQCYDGAGALSSCIGFEDGAQQRGATPPNPRFVVAGTGPLEGQGTVTDKLTGLIWLRNANCYGPVSWALAVNLVIQINNGDNCGAKFNQFAEGNWRIPNIKELYTLLDYGHVNPALPPGYATVFTNVPTTGNMRYWSSTTVENPGQTQNAWEIDFAVGTVNRNQPKTTNTYFVWPVRGPQ